jgi:hypothetical protein
MPRKRQRYMSIGTVSSGTMVTDDLIPDFIYELRKFNKKLAAQRQEEYDQLCEAEDEEGKDILLNEELFEDLQRYCPPWTYFGPHPGNGSDYGCWPPSRWELDDAIHDKEIVIVDAGMPWPKGGERYVLAVNDHGNMTMYRRKGRRELWSCV